MFFLQFAGRLGKDPETRFTPSGKKVTSFNVAVNLRKGKEEITQWVRVSVWREDLDKLIALLKKGSAVIINGRLVSIPSSYVDKEGRTQVSLDVVAEAVEFNPFGGPDRIQMQDGQPTQQGYQSHQTEYTAGMGTSATHEEPAYNSSAYTRNSYGAGATVGQGTHSTSLDDDALPF